MKVTDDRAVDPWPPRNIQALEKSTDVVVDDARVNFIVHDHTYTLTYFERAIGDYGTVRVIAVPYGLEVWVGGERRVFC